MPNLPGSAGASLLTAGPLLVPEALPAVPPLRVPSALRQSVLAVGGCCGFHASYTPGKLKALPRVARERKL